MLNIGDYVTRKSYNNDIIFQIIGIKNARQLLISYINVFFLDLEYIQKRFAKNGLGNSVNIINEDIDSIMNILYDED